MRSSSQLLPEGESAAWMLPNGNAAAVSGAGYYPQQAIISQHGMPSRVQLVSILRTSTMMRGMMRRRSNAALLSLSVDSVSAPLE